MSAEEPTEVNEEIKAVKEEIAGYIEERKNAKTAEERAEATSLINARSNYLAVLIARLPQVQAAATTAPATTIPQQESAPEEYQVNANRKKRWDALNKVLSSNKKAKTDEEGEFVSTSYSSITWEPVKSIFNPKNYTFDSVPMEDSAFKLLSAYLKMVAGCVPKLDGKEAKRLLFITPIIIAVCSTLEDVTVAVEEDLKGNSVKANGHFEMMLVRGNKRVCIVEAKKEDMDQGQAQCLVGCEVASDVDRLDVVYGIVTTYYIWQLNKSLNDKILSEEFSLDVKKRVPSDESLRELAGKICAMLTEEDESTSCSSSDQPS